LHRYAHVHTHRERERERESILHSHSRPLKSSQEKALARGSRVNRGRFLSGSGLALCLVSFARGCGDGEDGRRIDRPARSVLEFPLSALEDVEVLAALGLAVPRPDAPQQVANLDARARPAAPVLLGGVVLRAGAEGRAAAVASGPPPEEVAIPLGVLELQPDLGEEADEELVHVVVYPHRRLDEFAVVADRH
jgi:hypothetical protein